MKRCLAGVLLVILATGVSGCDASSDSRILSVHLVEHFRQNGFEGRFRRLDAKKIGAEQAGRYVRREHFDIELARFADAKAAKRLQRRGFNGFKVYAHGQYIMLVRRAESEKEMVKVFRKF